MLRSGRAALVPFFCRGPSSAVAHPDPVADGQGQSGQDGQPADMRTANYEQDLRYRRRRRRSLRQAENVPQHEPSAVCRAGRSGTQATAREEEQADHRRGDAAR